MPHADCRDDTCRARARSSCEAGLHGKPASAQGPVRCSSLDGGVTPAESRLLASGAPFRHIPAAGAHRAGNSHAGRLSRPVLRPGFRCRMAQAPRRHNRTSERTTPMAMPEFTLRQLLEAGVHFGHHTRRWNPRMAPYLFGVRNQVHIIDLQQTVPMLDRALRAVRDVVAAGGRVLFVGTKRAAAEYVADAAKRCGPVLRQPPLARRHADQLEDHHRQHQAPAPDRGDARRRHPGSDQEGGPGHHPRQGEARARAGRHQGHGRPAGHPVHHRHEQGKARGRGGEQARHPGGRGARQQLRPGRRHLSDPRQRRRDPRDHALLRPGRGRGAGRHQRGDGRFGPRHRCRRGAAA